MLTRLLFLSIRTGRVVSGEQGVATEALPTRLHYLDSIRITLSVLVILHHAAQPYCPADWWYVEGQPKAQWIEDFAVLNAPFKMSLFFLIAAYVLPAAVDRRRQHPYLRPRLTKLGGPIVVGFFLVIPVLMYAYFLEYRGHGPIGFGDYYWNVYLGAGDEPRGSERPDLAGPAVRSPLVRPASAGLFARLPRLAARRRNDPVPAQSIPHTECPGATGAGGRARGVRFRWPGCDRYGVAPDPIPRGPVAAARRDHPDRTGRPPPAHSLCDRRGFSPTGAVGLRPYPPA